MLNCYFVKLNKGFTLIELMVSLGILVVAILAALGIYINVIGTRQKTVGQLNIQEDGQYLMSLIVKDIRAGMVDYADHVGGEGNCVKITSAENPTSQLCLLDFSSSPNQIRYKTNLSASGVCSEVGGRCVLQRCEGLASSDTCNTATGSYQTITMTNVSFERLDFYISPTTDPFIIDSTNYEHPRVTIVLKLRSLREKTGEKLLVLQQTVPQRYTYRK
ncbi:prepilin-type N-terminal cleavage/methylation domain-containing protein [Patescibacteria group bacterium]|nr:prepilin-type N-terminal cleavage/methylation domain-containing protein [Patescibacteria group bacterium]